MATVIESPSSARVGGSKIMTDESRTSTQPMPAQSSNSNNTNNNNRSARMKSFINKSYRAKSSGGSSTKGQQHTRPPSDECTVDPPSVNSNRAGHKAVDPSANTLPRKNVIKWPVSASSIITPAIRAANAQKLHAMFAQNDKKASSARSRASNNDGNCNRSINTERYSTAPTIYSTRTSSSTVRASNTRRSSSKSGSMNHQGLAQAAAAEGGVRYTSYAPKSTSNRRPSSKENHRFNSSDTALLFHNSDTALFGEDSIKNEPTTSCATAQFRGQGGGGSSRSRRKSDRDRNLSNSMFNQSDTSLLRQPRVFERGGARRRKSKEDFGLSNSMFNQSDTSLLYANNQDFNSSCYEDGNLSFNQGGLNFCQPCTSSSTEKKRPEAAGMQQVQKKKSAQNNARKSSTNSPPPSSKPMPSTKSYQRGGINYKELSKNHPPPTSPRRHSMPTARTLPKKRPDPPSSVIPKRDGTCMIRRTQSSNVIRHSPPPPPPAVPSLANKDVSSSMKNSMTPKKVGSTANNMNTMSSSRGQQQRVLQPKKFNNQAHLSNRQETKSSTSSNDMNHGSSGCYQVGEALRNTSHYLSFTSSNQASILLQKLPLNSPLFVKRTTGAWTYATLVGRMTQDERNGGETSVIVNLDSSGTAKKILDQGKWERCARMVNHRKVFVPSAIPSGGGSRGLQRKNSAPPSLSTTIAAKASPSFSSYSSYGRKNSAPDLLQAAARPLTSATSKSVSFRCVDNTKNASSSSSFIRRNSAPEPEQLFPSDSKSVSFQRDTARGYVAEQHTRGSKMPGESLRNMLSSGTMISRECVTNNSQAAATAPRSIAMTSESTTPSRPSSDSPAKKSGNNKVLPQSPTTVVVNLNAKTFSGNRRDRMRPMLRKNSAPSLLNLGSLDGSKNKKNDMMMSSSDDSSVATCLPIGHDFEGGGLFINSSQSSSFDNGGAPKPPPYATNSIARSVAFDASSSHGGMNLRLRGVDP